MAAMSHDELERLLWEESDGTISGADRAALEELLERNDLAAHERHRVQACRDLLDSAGDVAPPPDLEAAIGRAIASLERPRRRPGGVIGFVQSLQPSRGVLVGLAAAAAVAGATILALVLADAGRLRPGDTGKLYGAAGVTSGERGETVTLAEALGTLTITPGPSSLTCRLETVASIAGGVTLRVIGAGLAIERVEGDSADAAEVVQALDAVNVTFPEGGAVTVTVRVPESATSVTVRVVAAGKPLAERTVVVTKNGVT